MPSYKWNHHLRCIFLHPEKIAAQNFFFQMTISWFWAQIQSDQSLISFVFTYVGIFLEKSSVAQLSPMHYCMSFAHYLLKFFSKMVGIPNKWFPKGEAGIPLETTRCASGNQEKSKQRSAMNKQMLLQCCVSVKPACERVKQKKTTEIHAQKKDSAI